MTYSEKSLLVYLESQLVIYQGFINKNSLTVSDWKTIEEWEHLGHAVLTKIKPPERTKKNGTLRSVAEQKTQTHKNSELPNSITPNPHSIFTHRIRLSKYMIERAWQVRLEKIEQFSPLVKSEETQNSKTQKLPNSSTHQLTTEMHEGWVAFLKAHNSAPTPVQNSVAEQLFQVFAKKKFRMFMNGKQSGKTWLLKTIDQYITSITKEGPKNEK